MSMTTEEQKTQSVGYATQQQEFDSQNPLEIGVDGVEMISPDELAKMDIDTQLVYVFLLASKLDNNAINGKIDEISGVTDKIEFANDVYKHAAAARKEAGKDGSTTYVSSLPEDANGDGVVDKSDEVYKQEILDFLDEVGIDPEAKYSREEWDVNMELIQKQQNQWIYDSEVITYDLEQIMSQAATNMQLATKMLSTVQSLREKTVGALAFR